MDSRKKKILFVIPSLDGGGAEKILIEILKALDPTCYEMSLAIFERKGAYLSSVPPHVEVYDLRKKNRYDLPFLVGRLTLLLMRLNPDTIMSFLFYANFIAVLARFFSNPKKTRLVVNEHSHLRLSPRHARFKRFTRFVCQVFYNRADVCIVPSEGIRGELVRFFFLRNEKVKVIYNPIDLKKINELKQEPLNFPGLLPGRYIVAVGRLVAEKGYPYLLRAYACVSGKVEEKLLILGEGEEKDALIKLTKDLGIESRVVFAGFQTNPYKFMKNAALFVTSSIWESFALVIVEAMASEVALVATRCPFGPEEIVTDGINGLLVPPADENALADSLFKLLKDPKMRERLIADGRIRAKVFDIHQILPRYEALF